MSPRELQMLERAENFGASAGDSTNQTSQLARRDFLKFLGGGLLVCLTPVPSWSQESGRGSGSHELPTDISAWLHIDADGHVKVFTGKVEVGQNIRTSLAQAVAEELRVPFDSITMVMGDTDLVPWDMGTFGSRTTPTMAPATAQHGSRRPRAPGGDGRAALERRSLKIGRRRRESCHARWFEVAHLWRTHARRSAGEERRR